MIHYHIYGIIVIMSSSSRPRLLRPCGARGNRSCLRLGHRNLLQMRPQRRLIVFLRVYVADLRTEGCAFFGLRPRLWCKFILFRLTCTADVVRPKSSAISASMSVENPSTVPKKPGILLCSTRSPESASRQQSAFLLTQL